MEGMGSLYYDEASIVGYRASPDNLLIASLVAILIYILVRTPTHPIDNYDIYLHPNVRLPNLIMYIPISLLCRFGIR